MPRLIATLLAVALLVFVPAVAHAQPASSPSAHAAQGAGDDQYSDPFTGSDQGSSDSGSNGSSGSPSGSSDAGSAPAPAAAAPASSAAPTTAAAPGDELPRTGLDAGALALAGGALLLGGVALRRRVAA
jgi:LPXTG-motif cell wall-anchored protein